MTLLDSTHLPCLIRETINFINLIVLNFYPRIVSHSHDLKETINLWGILKFNNNVALRKLVKDFGITKGEKKAPELEVLSCWLTSQVVFQQVSANMCLILHGPERYLFLSIRRRSNHDITDLSLRLCPYTRKAQQNLPTKNY